MKKFLAALVIATSLSSAACAEPARNLSTSFDALCWKYFATLNRDENIFYSPYGINAALSLLANGASGDTRREILNALEADNLNNLNDEYKNFSERVKQNYGGDNIFTEANLLLVDKSVSSRGLDKNFRRVVIDVYGSDVRKADFANNLDDEKAKITRLVADKTAGFIPNYKSVASAATLTDLLNVVYFKGRWALPFKSCNTAKATFTNRDGSKVNVDMMSRVFDNQIAYRETAAFKGIELPYKANAAMYVILPVDDHLDIADAWNAQTLQSRADFLDGLSTSPAFNGEVVVRLPKFELDIENDLGNNLRAMGMEKAFGDDAEFFNIINGTPLKFDNVRHRAKVKVDECGTEAAAVTEIPMVRATAIKQPPRRVYFIAERPFVFVIRDIESGVILFAGAVNRL